MKEIKAIIQLFLLGRGREAADGRDHASFDRLRLLVPIAALRKGRLC